MSKSRSAEADCQGVLQLFFVVSGTNSASRSRAERDSNVKKERLYCQGMFIPLYYLTKTNRSVSLPKHGSGQASIKAVLLTFRAVLMAYSSHRRGEGGTTLSSTPSFWTN